MARIAGINIPLNKHIVIGLTSIFGIGTSRARQICTAAGVKPEIAVKDLAEPEVTNLRTAVANFTVEGDLRRETSMNIKRLMILAVIAVSATDADFRYAANARVRMRAPERARVDQLNGRWNAIETSHCVLRIDG